MKASTLKVAFIFSVFSFVNTQAQNNAAIKAAWDTLKNGFYDWDTKNVGFIGSDSMSKYTSAASLNSFKNESALFKKALSGAAVFDSIYIMSVKIHYDSLVNIFTSIIKKTDDHIEILENNFFSDKLADVIASTANLVVCIFGYNNTCEKEKRNDLKFKIELF